MKPLVRKLAIAGACLLAAGAAQAGSVSVTLTQPERYADLPFTPWERDAVLKDLVEHFEKLGKKLPADQELKIEVLDVDLAGHSIPMARTGRDLRVLRGGADWPRIHLKYALEAGGKTVASGDANLSDMAYMNRISRFSDGDPVRFEKAMIDDWFKTTFEKRVAAR